MTKYSQPVLAFARPEDDSVDVIMSRLPAAKDLLLVPEIALAMDISNNVVRAWIEDGRLPAMPCGAGTERDHFKITRTTFRSFLEMRQKGLC